MLSQEHDCNTIAEKIVKTLGSHEKTFAHSKHIHIAECKNLGIKVVPLEELQGEPKEGCKDLQDCVLTIHHTYMHTFSNSVAAKIVENHEGNAMIVNMPVPVQTAVVR